jgi:hypothetical protein
VFDKARAYVQRRIAAINARRSIVPRSFTGLRNSDQGPAARGQLVVEIRPVNPETGQPGPWIPLVDDKNLVVTQAESLMAQMAINQGPGNNNSALGYIELGDPVTPAAPTLADTNLQASTGQRKVVAVTATGNQVKAEATWSTAEGNGFTYTEAGLFNGLLGLGLMFARKTFAGIAKTNAFELRFTWYITFLVNTSGGDCSGIALIGPSTVSAYTFYTAVGGEASIAATFDFTAGANHVDVFLFGQRQVPGINYNEAGPPLNAPIGGPPANKGVNLIAWTLNPLDEILLVHRTLG